MFFLQPRVSAWPDWARLAVVDEGWALASTHPGDDKLAPKQPVSVNALAALAALQSDSHGSKNTATKGVAARLSARQLAALRDFEAVGKRCLAEFNSEELSELLPAPEIAAAPETDHPETEAEVSCSTPNGKEQESSGGGLQEQQVKLMFDEFDTDEDGLISLSEFEQVLQQLGVGDQLGEDQLEALAKAADLNGDGFVDLEEFATWLKSFDESCEESAQADENEVDNFRAREEEAETRRELSELRAALKHANARANKAEDRVSNLQEVRTLEVRKADERLRKSEELLEDEANASVQFWRTITKTSASPKLDQALDMSKSEWLGHGKFGFVLRSQRSSDGRPCAVKLLSVRWAHLAVREWYTGQLVSEHPNIVAVDYEDVLMHADDDKSIAKLLMAGMREGTYRPPAKRTNLPDRYICLVQEFMNRGSVQDWMDQDLLMPGGLLTVMQRVASALAYMHSRGVSHNDIKPKNVLLHQLHEESVEGEVVVKLADLGLASKQADHFNDFWQFGMTTYCMTTGELFGQTKFQPELVETFVSKLANLTDSAVGEIKGDLPCAAAAAEGNGTGKRRVNSAIAQLPKLLRNIWTDKVMMAEVRDLSWLNGWSFFDGAPSES